LILTLQTTTFGAYGGIATYNRLVCRVLNNFDGLLTKQVLIMGDTSSDLSNHHDKLPNLQLRAFSRRRSSFARQVLRLGLTKKIDLALIGHVNYAPLGWMLKRLQPQMRFGVIIYGIDAWQPLGALRRRALQQADFIISISDYTRQRAIETNALTGKRILLLPNALEWTDEDSTKPSTLAEIKGTRLLSVCRLEQNEKYKGVDKVIEALPDIAKRVPDVQYLVVGGGSDLERHRRLAQEVGVSQRVHFLGFLSEEDLRSCYRDCHLFVMPSAGEGFGFVFLEAMKYGKAIVAANSGGAPEVVKHGVTGALVEYGAREQLTEVLTDLCLNGEKRKQLGQAGHTRLVDNFTHVHFKERFDELLLQEFTTASLYRSRREVLNVG
jgi:glycosyltransferase involved in cell wall biosynthesis